VLVGSVDSNTPASKAGLKRGDIILKINGKDVDSANDLRLLVAQTPPNTAMDLIVWRDNRTMDVKVMLIEKPNQEGQNTGQGENNGPGTLQGVQVQDLTPDMTQELGVPSGTRGVVITSVDSASAAAAAGLQRGMIIEEVNHKSVADVQQYRQASQSADDQPVLVLVAIPNQNGLTNYIVVEPVH